MDPLVPGTLLARLGRMADIVCRVDKRDVGERLRKVAQLALSADIVFFGEHPNVVTQAGQPLEQALRVRGPSGQDIGVGEPETGRQEGAFARRQAVRLAAVS